MAVKCSKCGAKITINGKSLLQPEQPHDEPSEERTRVASMADLDVLRANSSVDAPAPARPAPTPAPAAAEPQVSDGWYAIINGQQLGPLSPQETLGHLKAGRLDARTYVWRDGQADWLRADAVAELRALLAAPAHVAPPPFVPPARSVTPAPAAAAAPAAEEAAAPAESELKTEETPPPDEQEKAPEAAEAAPKPAELDRFLFEDELDSVPTQTGKPIDVASLVAKDLDGSVGGSAPKVDPFSLVPDSPSMSKPMEFGEATRFFMKQAGVTRRNPPWKIALAVFLFVAVPFCVLYLLSQMHLVPLEITRIDEATGQEVKTSVFSSEGISGLRNMLLGNKQQPVAKAKANGSRQVAVKGGSEHPATSAEDGSKRRDDGDEPLVASIDGPGMSDTQRQMMQDAIAAHGGVGDGPKVRPELADKLHVDGTPGLDDKVISETVGKNLKAFQICTETELRRNPGFKGGKIKLTISIGSSGIVTHSSIDKPDIERSDLGSCLKEKARKIVFPKFQGDPFDVEVPLVLAAGA